MIKDLIKIQATHGYTIDVAAEIASEYESAAGTRGDAAVPTVPASKQFIPFRLTFLGAPNIRGQRPEDGARYYTFVGTQRG
jgi:hypothetical protein